MGQKRSHSASFALLTYFSSYLKCHRAAAFIAGLINSQPMGFYQPAHLLEEAKRQKVTIFPVDILNSDWDCTLELDSAGEHGIRPGMRLVRGLHEDQGKRISTARESAPFKTVEDVACRALLSKHAVRA